MKKLMSSICAASLAATLSFTGLVTAQAQPFARGTLPAPVASSETPILVQERDVGRRGDWHRRVDRDRRWDRDHRWDRDRRHWRGDRRWHNDRRWRHRDRGDAWAAGAAGLVTGAIIGGVIANQPQAPRRVIRSGDAHVQWCYDRYRSYRSSDNTFQPYNGPRRQCNSPYG